MKYPDGSVVYLPQRNVYVGYLGGKVVCTRQKAESVRAWLDNGGSPNPRKNTVRTTTNVRTVSFDQNLRDQLVEETRQVVEKANRRFPSLNLPSPSVGFFQKSMNAGKAIYARHRVEYNELIAKTNRASFHNTVIHEVAHLIVHRMYPNAAQAHGPEFRHVMQVLGGNGARCHNYNVEAVVAAKGQKQYVWACSCQEHKVSARKHANMMKNPGGYKCKRCHTVVSFTKVI